MSSSISLSTFDNQEESITRIRESSLRNLSDGQEKQQVLKQTDGSHIRHKTEDFDDCDFQLPVWHQQSTRYQNKLNKQVLKPEFDTPKATNIRENQEKNLFELTDGDVSGNSIECLEQHARQVENWLNESRPEKSDEDLYLGEEDSQLGRVIGVRGFTSPNEFSRERKLSESFNKLKSDYLVLQSETGRMRSNLKENAVKFKRILKKKDYNIELLKAQLSRKSTTGEQNETKKHDSNNDQNSGNLNHELELTKLRNQLEQLESKSKTKDDQLSRLKGEISRLKDESDDKRQTLDEELSHIRNQLENFLSNNSEQTMLDLRKENIRLKSIHEMDLIELQTLKSNYLRLEDEYKDILNQQLGQDEEKNGEMKMMLTEFSRLQVYQPKLERLLEVERELKQELEEKNSQVRHENEQLKEQLRLLRSELNSEKMRSKKDETVEIERLLDEIKNWQEKYHRLKKEKYDSDELMRNYKTMRNQLDVRHQSDIDLVKESNRKEYDRMRIECSRLEEKLCKTEAKLEDLQTKLSQIEQEKQDLTSEMIKVKRELEIREQNENSNEVKVKKLVDNERKLRELINELEKFKLENNDLLDERETLKRHLERSKQQVEQLQTSFHHQQKAFEELKEKKEKELSKLRVNLNFEQYNRQVALKGIERELRVSLKELEAMKYRFSRRLLQSGNAQIEAT